MDSNQECLWFRGYTRRPLWFGWWGSAAWELGLMVQSCKD